MPWMPPPGRWRPCHAGCPRHRCCRSSLSAGCSDGSARSGTRRQVSSALQMLPRRLAPDASLPSLGDGAATAHFALRVRRPAADGSGRGEPSAPADRPGRRSRKWPTAPPRTPRSQLRGTRCMRTRDIEIGNFYMKKGDYDAAHRPVSGSGALAAGAGEAVSPAGRSLREEERAAEAVTAYRKYLKLYRTRRTATRSSKQIENCRADCQHEARPSGQGRRSRNFRARSYCA